MIASAVASQLVPHVEQLADDVKFGVSRGLNQFQNRDLYSMSDDKARVQELVNRVRTGRFKPTVIDGDGE
jgi:hypothetical protein